MFFNTPEVKEMEFEPLPNGLYRVMVDSLEAKATKAGTGRYVALQLHVVEGEFENRRIYHNFNIVNPSDTAAKIGKSEFKKFLRAIGHEEPLESEDELKSFVDRVLFVDVKTETKDGESRNRVKSFHDQVPYENGARGPTSQGGVGLDDIPF